jgi:hypothetical protein
MQWNTKICEDYQCLGLLLSCGVGTCSFILLCHVAWLKCEIYFFASSADTHSLLQWLSTTPMLDTFGASRNHAHVHGLSLFIPVCNGGYELHPVQGNFDNDEYVVSNDMMISLYFISC